MKIYVCHTCKEVLTKIYITYNKIVTKELLDLKLNKHLGLAFKSGYNITTIKEDTIINCTCPKCNDVNVQEIEITEENFITICTLLQNNKIKDAWETIFDVLL